MAPSRDERRGAVSWRSREPGLVEHRIATPRWTAPPLSIAVIADLHVAAPFTTLAHVARIVARVNAWAPDLILLPGDFAAYLLTPSRMPPPEAVARALAPLTAPLGVHAVLGNHDWKDDPEARASGHVRTAIAGELVRAGIHVLSNQATRLHGDAWLVGLDSQRGAKKWWEDDARDDLDGAYGAVPDGAPSILMAHEPDVFARGDPRAVLQVSGHTHGGQGVFWGRRPMTPSRFGDRYAWGHMVEDEPHAPRHLVVSGGVGFSGLPLRLFQPPELTLIALSGSEAQAGAQPGAQTGA